SNIAIGLTGPFMMTADGCSGAPLAAHASCTVAVSFAPVTTGTSTGELTASASTGGQATAQLSGAGLGGGLVMLPTILTYASTTVGQSTVAQRVSVDWSGPSPTGMLSTSLTG